MQPDDAPAALGNHEDVDALQLQGEETQVMYRDGQGRDQNRQPVAVVHQEGEQGKDAEVHLQHAVGLVDVQRSHGHEGYAEQAAQQAFARDQRREQAQRQSTQSTYCQCLSPGAGEAGQHQRVEKQEPEHAEHDPVSLAVVLLEGDGGMAHRLFLVSMT